MICDYHLHSEFSFDSSEKIENICEKAISAGVSEIAITDHAEWPIRAEAPWPDFQRRSEVISRCRELYKGKLEIREGIEVGQPWRNPGNETKSVLSDIDFVIASAHELDGYPDPRAMTYTEDMIIPYFNCYIDQMISMAENCDYDVIGHVTYLFRFLPIELVEKYPPESFIKRYEMLFLAVIRRNKGIEVNCSGLRMPAVKNLLPSPQLLGRYKELGGKFITVGSDGHSCRSAFSGIEDGYAALKAAGFLEATAFEKRKAIQYRF